MAYTRKGGKGLSGSLQQQLKKVVRQYEKRLIEEYAFKRARGLSPEGFSRTFFKKFNYEDISKVGITRKKGFKTVRYYGAVALRTQIKALYERSSKTYQAENYIENYLKSLKELGVSEYDLNRINRAFHSISIDKLTYLINEGILPSLYYNYAYDQDLDKLVEDIITALKKGVSNEDWQRFKNNLKFYKSIAKEELKRNGFIG